MTSEKQTAADVDGEGDVRWQEAAASLELTVRFVETDAMGVVHHSTYVVWFEAGRVAWMDAAQMPYTEIAAGGRHFAVTALRADYRTAAHFGDRVRVVTWVERLRSRQVAFRYEVRHAASDELLATGMSEHVCVDLDGRVAKIPAAVMARLRAGAQRLAQTQGAGVD
jgi:acyl-CoA thioester hydrolase